MLCDTQLKLGELVKIIEGPRKGETGIIQDVLGKRTYVISNNEIVDRYEIEVMHAESAAMQHIKDYVEWVDNGFVPGDFLEIIRKRMKDFIDAN